ncbi:unnamed protein product [Echinostoma caproni]|uniref:Secreted protein n=1 Tax=Echinostoma caproni TaxID=27848 RepID=A0A183BDK9_9TREM|nr:unnamed protein product [Echinostoma caproni]
MEPGKQSWHTGELSMFHMLKQTTTKVLLVLYLLEFAESVHKKQLKIPGRSATDTTKFVNKYGASIKEMLQFPRERLLH